MADHLESRLVVDALELAVQRRLPDEELLLLADGARTGGGAAGAR